MIEAGLDEVCPEDRGGCGRRVSFSAQIPSRLRRRVIANIHFHGKWNRTEQWHIWPCYLVAGMPYGYPSGLKPEDHETMLAVLSDAAPDVSPEQLMEELITRYRQNAISVHGAP
jgi:hypothetical protein